MIIRGSIDGLWLNENQENQPARIKVMRQYFATFKTEILEPFQFNDFVEVDYHMETNKYTDKTYNVIDAVKHIKDLKSEEIYENIESREEEEKSNVDLVTEAKDKVNKIFEELEANINGT